MVENERFTIADRFKIMAICDDDGVMNSRQVCDTLNELDNKIKLLKEDLDYFWRTYSNQEYGLDYETHIQLVSPIPSRKELLKENEQLKQEIDTIRAIKNDILTKALEQGVKL